MSLRSDNNNITLKEIVSYLTNIDDEMHIVESTNHPNSLQNGDIESIDNFGDWIKSIFKKWKDDIKVMGIQDNSIYSPVMTCIDSKFEELELSEKKKYMLGLRSHLRKEINRTEIFEQYGYKKLGWKKNILTSTLNLGDQTMEILRLLADYFNINIFVIDNDDRQIQIHYSDGHFSPFKENVFLMKTKTGFDLIIFKNMISTINYNDSFLREFIKIHEKNLICPSYDLTKDANVIRPFQILKAGTQNIESEDNINDVFCKKMKLDQIQKFAKEYGIPIKMGKKFKTKNILYEEIKEKLHSKGIDSTQPIKNNTIVSV
jgi:hypothetical protein